MKPLSLKQLHLASAAVILAILLAFASFVAAISLLFGRYLIGDIPESETPSVLSPLDSGRFERAVMRSERRRAIPDVPERLRNPFVFVPDGPPASVQ